MSHCVIRKINHYHRLFINIRLSVLNEHTRAGQAQQQIDAPDIMIDVEQALFATKRKEGTDKTLNEREQKSKVRVELEQAAGGFK